MNVDPLLFCRGAVTHKSVRKGGKRGDHHPFSLRIVFALDTSPLTETPEHESHTEIGEHGYTKNLLGRIVAREQRQLSRSEIVILFEDLVTCGLAWKSTGAVSRTASHLTRDGWINP